MPLKPLIHPVKVFCVFPVYEIISSLIFNRPYFAGHPDVSPTLMVVSSKSILEVTVVNPTMDEYVPTFVYWSIFSRMLIGAP